MEPVVAVLVLVSATLHPIWNALAKRDRAPERVNIYEIMSKPVIPLDPDMDVRYCARMFEQFGLAIAPVIEGGNVMGMVRYDELVFKGLMTGME